MMDLLRPALTSNFHPVYYFSSFGSGGVLCGSCLDGFTYSSASLQCVECGSAAGTPVVVVVIFAAILAVGLLYLYGVTVPTWMLRLPPFNILKHLDSGMLKVLWATMQVIGTVAWNLSVEFPPPFSSLISLLGVLRLDFLSLDCVSGKSNYFSRVLAMSLGPIIFIMFVGAALGLRLSAAALSSAERRSEIVSQHAYAFLLVTYLVLPPCAMTQFQVKTK